MRSGQLPQNGPMSNTEDETARHRQIAQQLRNDIEAGRLRPGQRLPSTRELAAQFGTSIGCVNDAMDLLSKDSLIYSRPRSGRIVTEPEPLAAQVEQHSRGLDLQIDDIRSTPDPIRRAQLANDLITEYQLRVAELCGIRQTAITHAHNAGMTIAEIGTHLRNTR
jgi:DNA-binding FadR family transcriptional regulator